MRKVTVTYTLTNSQEEKIDKIRKHLNNRDFDETFQYLMELGSVDEINKKLGCFEEFYGLSNTDNTNEKG